MSGIKEWKKWTFALAALACLSAPAWAQEPTATAPPEPPAQAAPVLPEAVTTPAPAAPAQQKALEPTTPVTGGTEPAGIVAPLAGQVTAPKPANNQPPRIMTTSLMRKQRVDQPNLVVHFVVVDDDPIVAVSINGVAQKFNAANTLLLSRKFSFEPGRTLISVVATDQKGNQQSRSFLVLYEPDPEKAVAQTDPADRLNWNVVIELGSEEDSNPTEDLSSPVKLGDLELQGVVEDSQQTDTKQKIRLIAVATRKEFNGLVGVAKSTYAKQVNELLNSQMIFAGAGWKHPLSETLSFKADYLFSDINLGANDYAQYHGLTPGLLWETQTKEETSSHFFTFDLVLKQFADTGQKDGHQNGFKWLYQNTDLDKDKFVSLIAFGTGTQGTAESEESYFTMNFDWHNQWSGPFWDLGFGMQYEAYKNQVPLSTNTPLGKSRLDLPINYSTALGWQGSNWMIQYHYRYLLNLSNKVLYERTVQGFSASATF